MEEGTISMLHRRRPKANGTIICPRMSHPQRAPSGQDVDQQAFTAVRSLPTTAYSPNLAQGQGLYVSNLESNRITYQRQVSDAGDGSLQALWLLFLKLQPSLCSLLGNLADWHGPQEELVRTDIVEEPSPTEHSANETQIQRQSNESKCYLFLYCLHTNKFSNVLRIRSSLCVSCKLYGVRSDLT